MVDRGLSPAAWRAVAAVAVVLILVVAGKLAWDRYDERYTVERRDDGAAVTRVVRATFAGASALKVGALSGTVQSTATDTRGFGLLTSDRVMKAPFAADYFVDVSRLGTGGFAFDAAARTLTVYPPDVTVGAINVDEAATSVARTRGLYVTRDAAETLARRSSLAARRTAEAEARRPERIDAARANARRALANLLGAPLAAAGLGDVRVAVVFPFERRGPSERWDTSRTIDEVLRNS